MTNQQPVLALLDLVVRDMDATLAFYRRLGLEIPDHAVWRTASISGVMIKATPIRTIR
jgi:hypothetical protein